MNPPVPLDGQGADHVACLLSHPLIPHKSRRIYPGPINGCAFFYRLDNLNIPDRIRRNGERISEAVLKLIMAVVVAAILDLTVFLCRGVLFHPGPIQWSTVDLIALAWVALSLILLRLLKINIIAVIGLSILAGLARWSLHAL